MKGRRSGLVSGRVVALILFFVHVLDASAQEEPLAHRPRVIEDGRVLPDAEARPVTEILVKLRDEGDAADVAARGTVSGSRRPALAAAMARLELREGRRLFRAVRHERLDRIFKFRSARLSGTRG